MGHLGISNETLVVAYDDMGLPLGSARLWWALSFYGHDRVKVLDGGLRQWQIERRPLSTDIPPVEPTVFSARPRAEWVANKADVVAALESSLILIIDCLSQERYSGSDGNDIWERAWGTSPAR